MDTLLSIEQTAQKLQIQPETVRRYIREGQLTAAKIGRDWRVRDSDLRAFAEARIIPSPAQGSDANR